MEFMKILILVLYGIFGYKDSTGVIRYIPITLPTSLSDSAFLSDPTLWTTRMKMFDDSLKIKYHR